MCKMSSKDYLNQLFTLKQAMDEKHRQMEQLQSVAERTTGAYEALRVGGTNRRSKLEDAAIDIMELKDELGVIASSYAKKYREIFPVIDSVKNPTYHKILSLRYLEHKSWKKIAAEMHYSRRHVLRMHGEALLLIKIPNN